MKEIFGDAFELHLSGEFDFDILCITTNGFVKDSGKAVMGAGIAKQARDKIKGIDYKLGSLIKANGNVVQQLATAGDKEIVAFPVKHNWWEQASHCLILSSLVQLMKYANGRKILLPRPGCGNGGLKWSQVRQTISAWDYPNLFIVAPDYNITIKNLKEEVMQHPWQVRVDRQSVLGNPYKMNGTSEEERDRVCDKYALEIEHRAYANESVKIALNQLYAIYKQYGKLELFCWCTPKRCHADAIRSYLVSMIEEGVACAGTSLFPI